MTPRKKRLRYKTLALEIAKERGIPLSPDDWDGIWATLDGHKKHSSKRSNLYAIIDLSNNLVKFGKAIYPKARLKCLKTGNGNKLVLAGFCPEDKLSEKEVHKKLDSIRVSGEWFKMNEQSQRVIDEIRNSI